MEFHGANQMIDECDECYQIAYLAPHPENCDLYLCEDCLKKSNSELRLPE